MLAAMARSAHLVHCVDCDRVPAASWLSDTGPLCAPTGVGWRAAGDEVVGRIEVDTDCQPRVAVDGRPSSWDELGEALESLEGFQFRLIVEDRIADLRSPKD